MPSNSSDRRRPRQVTPLIQEMVDHYDLLSAVAQPAPAQISEGALDVSGTSVLSDNWSSEADGSNNASAQRPSATKTIGLSCQPPLHHRIEQPTIISIAQQRPNTIMNQPPPMMDWGLMFPRIMVGPATFIAYALMRGFPDTAGDPLHYALCAHPDRRSGANLIFVQMVPDYDQPGPLRIDPSKGLPPGYVVYWDPLIVKPPSAPVHRIKNPSNRAKVDTAAYPYKFHKLQYVSIIKKNHFTGDRVYENFGYIRDPETNAWIDPDATGLLIDIYNSQDFKETNGEGDGCHIPDFRLSEQNGPRCLCAEELDEFYQWFMSYVPDEADQEGDPRRFRYPAAIFARWAEGAKRGEHYEEETFRPNSVIWRYRAAAAPKSRTRKTEDADAFDVGTGEWLFDGDGFEDEPALLLEPAGVNLETMPLSFHMMMPNIARDLNYKAFGDGRSRATESQEGGFFPSPFDKDLPRNFSNDIDHLFRVPESRSIQKKVGLETLRPTVDCMSELEGFRFHSNYIQKEIMDDMGVMAEKRIDLKREIFFLRRRIDEDRARSGPLAHVEVPTPGYKSQEPDANTPFVGINNRGEKINASALLTAFEVGEPSLSTSVNVESLLRKTYEQPGVEQEEATMQSSEKTDSSLADKRKSYQPTVVDDEEPSPCRSPKTPIRSPKTPTRSPKTPSRSPMAPSRPPKTQVGLPKTRINESASQRADDLAEYTSLYAADGAEQASTPEPKAAAVVSNMDKDYSEPASDDQEVQLPDYLLNYNKNVSKRATYLGDQPSTAATPNIASMLATMENSSTQAANGQAEQPSLAAMAGTSRLAQILADIPGTSLYHAKHPDVPAIFSQAPFNTSDFLMEKVKEEQAKRAKDRWELYITAYKRLRSCEEGFKSFAHHAMEDGETVESAYEKASWVVDVKDTIVQFPRERGESALSTPTSKVAASVPSTPTSNVAAVIPSTPTSNAAAVIPSTPTSNAAAVMPSTPTSDVAAVIPSIPTSKVAASVPSTPTSKVAASVPSTSTSNGTVLVHKVDESSDPSLSPRSTAASDGSVLPKHQAHYKAYMDGELERQTMQMVRLHAVIALTETQYEDICMEVEDLTAERDKLLETFGVEHCHQIPNFWLPGVNGVCGESEETEESEEMEGEEEFGGFGPDGPTQADYDAVEQPHFEGFEFV